MPPPPSFSFVYPRPLRLKHLKKLIQDKYEIILFFGSSRGASSRQCWCTSRSASSYCSCPGRSSDTRPAMPEMSPGDQGTGCYKKMIFLCREVMVDPLSTKVFFLLKIKINALVFWKERICRNVLGSFCKGIR